jgi:hypothetical protein
VVVGDRARIARTAEHTPAGGAGSLQLHYDDLKQGYMKVGSEGADGGKRSVMG